MQRGLVALYREHVIGLGVDDRLGDFGLAAHRVDGHQTARDFQDLQEFASWASNIARRRITQQVVGSYHNLLVTWLSQPIGHFVQEMGGKRGGGTEGGRSPTGCVGHGWMTEGESPLWSLLEVTMSRRQLHEDEADSARRRPFP